VRIAREIHDTLLQSFQGLMLRFQIVDDLLPAGKAKEALQKALERADQAIAEGRDSIHDLRSSTVIGHDLGVAVAALGDELASEDSATFGLTVEGMPRNVPSILRDEIYRIAREAVRNAFRHAAWEANARVALAELDAPRAQECIAKAWSTMEGFEVPLASWRVHATAFEFYRSAGDRDSAERYRALSRETIMKLANSLPTEEPLRHIFLSSPMVRRVFGDDRT
jgi:hypothetical protein